MNRINALLFARLRVWLWLIFLCVPRVLMVKFLLKVFELICAVKLRLQVEYLWQKRASVGVNDYWSKTYAKQTEETFQTSDFQLIVYAAMLPVMIFVNR
jgi:hypothetical protein